MNIRRRQLIALVTLFVLSPAGCSGDKGTGTKPPPPTLSGNQVVIESKTVSGGADSVTVGIYVANEVALNGLVIPLEFRAVTPGSYITNSCKLNMPSDRRIGASPLTDMVVKLTYGDTGGVPCSGPTSGTYAISSPIDFTSPDGFMWAGISTASPPTLYYLPPGQDDQAGQFDNWPSEGESKAYVAGPSFEFVFDVTSTMGTFEIDTCCVTPGNHLEGTDLEGGTLLPSFTKSVITLR
ncbi:MAG: hypothetical protein AB1792_08390 [Candidatus Zixiibacteriota bacterium]